MKNSQKIQKFGKNPKIIKNLKKIRKKYFQIFIFLRLTEMRV